MTGPLLTLLNAQSLAAYTAAGYWSDETLYAVAARPAGRGAICGLARRAERDNSELRSQPDRLFPLPRGHHRNTERRPAQRQHPACNRAYDGARLAARGRCALHAEPAIAQSRHR